MKKSIIFCIIVVLNVVLASLELAFIGLPEPDFAMLTVCSVCVCLGLIYMRLSLYEWRDILWCLGGGVALTMLVVFGAHFVRFLPLVIDCWDLDGVTLLLMSVLAALFVTMIYGYSLYLFVFYFCEMRKKIQLH